MTMQAISLGPAGRAGTMSIAVMNWVWGLLADIRQRALVLLALPTLGHSTIAPSAAWSATCYSPRV
jgi:hypothetical protein